ncbi:hypothetical protein BH10CYA1_BH10CYA1_65000 [soil metagenome]
MTEQAHPTSDVKAPTDAIENAKVPSSENAWPKIAQDAWQNISSLAKFEVSKISFLPDDGGTFDSIWDSVISKPDSSKVKVESSDPSSTQAKNGLYESLSTLLPQTITFDNLKDPFDFLDALAGAPSDKINKIAEAKDKSSERGSLKVNGSSIDETDKTGTRFHKDKETGTITETGAKGTVFERRADGSMTLTDGDRKFVLTADNKMTETTGDRTIEITDQSTISRFRNTGVEIFQHHKPIVPESEQKEPGIHTLAGGVIRVNAEDGTKLFVYANGDKRIEAKDGTQYLIKSGEQSIIMVVADGTPNGKRYLVDQSHNSRFARFNRDGSVTVNNQTIGANGEVTTSDEVKLDGCSNRTTIKNANGDGKDAVVTNNSQGVSTVTDGSGTSTTVDDNTGMMTQRNINGRTDTFDTVNHRFNIDTADGLVKLSDKMSVLWNGDVLDDIGNVLRAATGTLIGADNSVHLRDGSGFDSLGNSLTRLGEAQAQSAVAQSLIAQAKSVSMSIIYEAGCGKPSAGQIGQLLGLYSQLGDAAGRSMSLGDIGSAAAASFAQSDCAAGIGAAALGLKVQDTLISATGSATAEQIHNVQTVTSSAPSEQVIQEITKSVAA